MAGEILLPSSLLKHHHSSPSQMLDMLSWSMTIQESACIIRMQESTACVCPGFSKGLASRSTLILCFDCFKQLDKLAYTTVEI